MEDKGQANGLLMIHGILPLGRTTCRRPELLNCPPQPFSPSPSASAGPIPRPAPPPAYWPQGSQSAGSSGQPFSPYPWPAGNYGVPGSAAPPSRPMPSAPSGGTGAGQSGGTGQLTAGQAHGAAPGGAAPQTSGTNGYGGRSGVPDPPIYKAAPDSRPESGPAGPMPGEGTRPTGTNPPPRNLEQDSPSPRRWHF